MVTRMTTRTLVIAIVLFAATAVSAQPAETPQPAETAQTPAPPPTTSEALRDGNAAAMAGDWLRVAQLVDPLLTSQLQPADLAEAHRLAGLAAFFQGQKATAEAQFLAYLRIDLDGQLDPALYPPEAVIFFNDVKTKHKSELRARRPKSKRYWILNLVPPFGQFQNGHRTKGFILGGTIAAMAIGNATSFFVLRSWCTEVIGDGGSSVTCDDSKDRVRSANQLRTVNIVTGIGLILSYAYGVYDGVQGYRRRTRETAVQPFVSASRSDSVFGIAGTF